MRFMLLVLLIAIPGALKAQSFTAPAATQPSTPAQAASTLSARPVIAGNGYSVTNPVTFAKTANGLLIVLSPGTLTGSGSLAGHQQGLSLEIPDTFILQLF